MDAGFLGRLDDVLGYLLNGEVAGGCGQIGAAVEDHVLDEQHGEALFR